MTESIFSVNEFERGIMVKKMVVYDGFQKLEVAPEGKAWRVTVILVIDRGGKREERTVAEEVVSEAEITSCMVKMVHGKIVAIPEGDLELRIYHDIESDVKTLKVAEKEKKS
nr:hypothetical protein [Candidatus Freyrarchaeum guaymaensis]HDO80673.1 hypothetical protein [Candidatus Bathyarchaeota archaeon]